MNNVLICLIGSNPLPVYLVCEYLNSDERHEEEKKLLPKPDKIIFLCSDETKIFAEKLKEKCRLLDKLVLIQLGDERNAKEIKNKLSNYLNEVAKNADSIHLNYTGGTKPMAVHSYQCVKEFCRNNINFIASDVYDKISKIRVDSYSFHNHAENIYYPRDPNKKLYNFVKIDCETLFELHNMELLPEKKGKITLAMPEIKHEKIFQGIIIDKEGEEIGKKINEIKEKFDKKIYKLNGEELNQDFEIVKKYNADYDFGLDISSKVDLEKYGKKRFKRIIDYLHGKWLEDYFFKAVDEIKDESDLCDLRLSVNPQYKGRDCEIDVIAIKGYKLYLFSCTTSDEIGTCKSKAFEAIYRAEQLGGQHAKAICVNLMPENYNGTPHNNEELQKDMSSFGAKLNFDYIGFETLSNKEQLKEKLKCILSD